MSNSWYNTAQVAFDTLVGKTIVEVKPEGGSETYPERLSFICESGHVFGMYHLQDCCEWVYLAEVIGDWNDVLGQPILRAEERTNEGTSGMCISYTWTFYTLWTARGALTLRWCGESNGYYSESVDFFLLEGSNNTQKNG